MKIWIQLQKWFHPIVYAYAVISSQGNLSTWLRNGTSEGVDFMRWGRKDGRTEWELCFVVTKVKLSIYLLAYLSHFYSERLICPPQWDEILSKVALKFLCKLINISEVTKKSSGKVHITTYIVGYFVKRGVSASADKSNIVLPLLILNRLL